MSTLATQPYNKAVTATKSDTVNFSDVYPGRSTCDALYVGGAGVCAVVFADDTVVNFTCVAGQTLPVKAKRLNSTNTTATLTNALYYV